MSSSKNVNMTKDMMQDSIMSNRGALNSNYKIPTIKKGSTKN